MLQRIKQEKKKVKAVMVLVLVATLVLNHLPVRAEVLESQLEYKVYSYDDLVSALSSASSGDQIGIYSEIIISPYSTIFEDNIKLVTLCKMAHGASIIFRDTSYSMSTPYKVNDIDFDGNYIVDSNPFVQVESNTDFKGCYFTECVSLGAGGALSIGFADVNIDYCYLHDNSGGDGGAIAKTGGGALSISNSHIHDNEAGGMGGGFYLASGSTTFNNCVIYSNKANMGGGIGGYGAFSLTNTLVYNNTANYQGADYIDGGSVTINDTMDTYTSILTQLHTGLEAVRWESDSVDGTACYKLITQAKTTPEPEPDPTEPPSEDPTDPPTEPSDPPSGEPTDPPADTPSDTPADTPTQDPTTPSGGDTYNDNHTEDNHTEDNHTEDNHTEDNHTEDNSTNDNHTEDNHTEDNSTHTDSHTEDNSTHTDSHTEDNSTHTDSHTEDNSTHTDNHTEDNSSSTSDSHNTDSHDTNNNTTNNTDSHDSSVSNVDNRVTSGDTVSNNTTNNDYRSYTYTTNNTDNSKSSTDNHSSTRTGTTGGSQPVNVTVNIPEAVISPQEAHTSSQPNINIYSENVEVIYTSSEDGGYTIDIKDKDSVKMVPLSYSGNMPTGTPESSNKPNKVDYAILILLAILVLESLGEKIVKMVKK